MTRLTDQERLYRSVSEAALQKQCQDLADLLHAPYFHDMDSRRNRAGLPDVVLCVNQTLFLWELKRETEELREGQFVWAEALGRVTEIDYRVVRPSSIDAAVARVMAARGR